MRWSLRTQLLVPLLALLLGVVAMSIWAAISSATYARERIQHQVRDIAVTLNGASFPLTEQVLLLLKGFTGADYLLIERTGIRVTTLPQAPSEIPPPDYVGSRAVPTMYLKHRVELQGTTYFYTGIKLDRGRNAGAAVYIFYPETLWRAALWQAVRPALLLGILCGLAAIVFAVLLAHRLTRRIRRLEEQTRFIAEGDFSPMPVPWRHDELRDLTESVNKMAARLAMFQETMQKNERMRLLGQVSSGLAHQMRNGVTGARLAVQVHARACTISEEAEALDVALRQLALVEVHLKHFLDLGRRHTVEWKSCLLPKLLEDSLALVRPQCRHAHVDLRWHPTEGDVTIRGNGEQLGQVFLNVLINAIEAAGTSGWVEVHLGQTDTETARVRISDSGPGPRDDVAAQLFEPFVTGKPEGIGLGLAVSREIVEAHGGTIGWERQAEQTNFLIDLPLERAV